MLKRKLTNIFIITFVLSLLFLVVYRVLANPNEESNDTPVSTSYSPEEAVTFSEEDSMIDIDMPSNWNIEVERDSSEILTMNDRIIQNEFNEIKIETDTGVDVFIRLTDYEHPEDPYLTDNASLLIDCYPIFYFEKVGEIKGEAVYRTRKEYTDEVLDPHLLYSQADHYQCSEVCREDANMLSYKYSIDNIEEVFISYDFDETEDYSDNLESIFKAIDESISSIDIRSE